MDSNTIAHDIASLMLNMTGMAGNIKGMIDKIRTSDMPEEAKKRFEEKMKEHNVQDLINNMDKAVQDSIDKIKNAGNGQTDKAN